MNKWFICFTGHTLSGLGGGALGPVTVESYCEIEAKDFEDASKKASWVAKAIGQGVYSVSQCDLTEDKEDKDTLESLLDGAKS